MGFGESPPSIRITLRHIEATLPLTLLSLGFILEPRHSEMVPECWKGLDYSRMTLAGAPFVLVIRLTHFGDLTPQASVLGISGRGRKYVYTGGGGGW